MPLKERFVDFIVPQRSFKGELNKEVETCLEFFNDPCVVKGIGITVGRLGNSRRAQELLDKARGEPRGYFWEKDGIRHMIGQEVMTRQQKDGLVRAIHRITFPYAEEVANRKQS